MCVLRAARFYYIIGMFCIHIRKLVTVHGVTSGYHIPGIALLQCIVVVFILRAVLLFCCLAVHTKLCCYNTTAVVFIVVYTAVPRTPVYRVPGIWYVFLPDIVGGT